MTDVVGFAMISQNANAVSSISMDNFRGKNVRVLEFERHGDGALVVDNDSKGLAMFEKKDIVSSFKCSFFDNVVCPPGLNPLQQSAYSFLVKSRVGGYNNLLREMVIMASLHKRKFNDLMLWQMQPQSKIDEYQAMMKFLQVEIDSVQG